MPVYKHLFGPVPSRRLGISLGIDVIPQKTCTLDCVYCECGCTTDLTLERKNYFPTQEITAELADFLNKKPKVDYLTFAGSGEPTLALNLGEIISFIKTNYPEYKLALLTNGTLLFLPEVRDQIKDCDLVKISIDSATPPVFQKINRFHKDLNVQKIIQGIQDFSREYKGRLWLEIFIVPGFNDQEPELQEIKKIINNINCEKIQLNSLDRPGAESWVKTPNPQDLQRVAAFLKPLPVEIVNLRTPPKTFFKKINKNESL